MLIALILLLLVVLVFFYYITKNTSESLFRQSSSKKNPKKALKPKIHSRKFCGFFIDYPDETKCCDAVLRLNKKPFPINSVPVVPLDKCSEHFCFCTQVGLVEKRTPFHQRRKSKDRRDAIRFQEVSDRRSHLDRRSDKWCNPHNNFGR